MVSGFAPISRSTAAHIRPLSVFMETNSKLNELNHLIDKAGVREAMHRI
jgi:hypothetical protein